VLPVSNAWKEGEPQISTDVSSEDEAAADELMRQLEESGFRYDHAERVTGIGEGNDGASDPPPGDGGDQLPAEPPDDPDAGPQDAPLGDTPGEGADAGDGDGAPAPGTDAGLSDDVFELAGTKLTGPEARALLHIRKQLMDHPEMSGRFSEILQTAGKPPPPPVVDTPPDPPELKLPDFIDPDDETAKGIWQSVVELRARHEAQERRQTEMQAEEQAQRVRRDVSAGQAAFKAAHPDLSPEDLAAVYATTSANVDVGQIMANFPGDPAQGIARAYEVGARIDDRLRDKVLATGGASTQKAADAERQRKLAALGGSSGSTASRAPGRKRRATSWTEISAQLAEEIERASS
jgi:hypothetical protein